MSVGDKIRSTRKERGLTQKELGSLCGMADSAIRRYESNRGNPTEKTLQRIADALGVSPDYLLGESHLKGILNHRTSSIKQTIFEYLDKSKLSNEDLCKEINLPFDEWFRWKEDSSKSYLNHLPEIAELLNIPPTELDISYTEVPTQFEQLKNAFSACDFAGRQKAIERVAELTEISRYQRSDMQNAAEENTFSSSESPTDDKK